MPDVRQAIDDFNKRGQAAILALAILAMIRRALLKKTDITIAGMIHDIDSFVRRGLDCEITGAKFNELPRAHSFSAYLDPGHRCGASCKGRGASGRNAKRRNKPHDMKSSNGALSYFCDYVMHDMKRLAKDAPVLCGFAEWRSEKPFVLASEAGHNGRLRLIAELLCREEVRGLVHPGLQWQGRDGRTMAVPAFSAETLGLSLLGVSRHFRDANPAAKVYYVFREARGVFSAEPERLNMIVRDVLWLRRAPMRTSESKAREDIAGFYFSAVDGYVYVIDAGYVVSEGYMQMFGSRLNEEGKRDEHHFYLNLRLRGMKVDGVRRHSGLLCGSTTNKRSPAAWKLLAVAEKGNSLFVDLETIFKQESLIEKRTGGWRRVAADEGVAGDAFEARKLEEIVAFLQSRKVLGVLAAHGLANERSAQEEFKVLRKDLKKLLWSGRDATVDSITRGLFYDLLNRDALDAWCRLQENAAVKADAQKLIDGILRSWRNLEALHIFAPSEIIGGDEAEAAVKRLIASDAKVPSGADLRVRNKIRGNRRLR